MSQRVRYGGTLPSPDPTQSLTVTPLGNVSLQPDPSPMNALGQQQVEQGSCQLTRIPRVAIEEVRLRCMNGAHDYQYVRIRSLSVPEVLDTSLVLRAYDRNEQITGSLVIASGTASRVWPVGATWFVGSAGWTRPTGGGPDRLLPFVLDSEGGRLELVGRDRIDGSLIVIQDLRYGTPEQPIPPLGGSLLRTATGEYVARSTPNPVAFDQSTLVTDPLCMAPGVSSARIDGFQLRDAQGLTTAQWLSIAAPALPQIDTTVRVEIFDRLGRSLATLQPLPPASGQLAIARKTYLTRCFEEVRTEILPNQYVAFLLSDVEGRLPCTMDTLGGRFEVTAHDAITGERTVLQSLSYGPGGVAAPGPDQASVLEGTNYTIRTQPAIPLVGNLQARPANRFFPAPRLSELFVGCPSDTAAISYLALENPSGNMHVLDGRAERAMYTRVLDHAGQTIIEGPLAIALSYSDRGWTSPRVLLTSPALAASASSPPDGVFSRGFDPEGGRIELGWLNESGGFEVFDSVDYSVAETPALAQGSALARDSVGLWRPAAPVPQNYTGRWFGTTGCLSGARPPVLISELLPTCYCDLSASFVELQSQDSRLAGLHDLTLVHRDRLGTERWRSANVMTGPPPPWWVYWNYADRVGKRWGKGDTYLVASHRMSELVGNSPSVDNTMPLPLEANGELILLHQPAPGTVDTIQVLKYGALSPNPRTHAGWSLNLTPTGDYIELPPAPQVFGEQQPVLRGDALLACQGTGTTATLTSAVWRCRDGSGGISAIQLHTPGRNFPPEVGVRAFDRTGQLLFTIDQPLGMHECTTTSEGDSYWLLGTSTLESLLGTTVDGLLPLALDHESGAIELYESSAPGKPAYARYAYGRPGDPVVPAGQAGIPGVSTGSGYVVLLRSDGADLRAPSCLDHGPGSMLIDEVVLACKDGGTSGQYVQLKNPIAPQYHDSRIRLRILDHDQNEIARLEPLAPQSAGARVPTGAGLLLANPGFEAATGLKPDVVLPVALDPQGGVVSLEWLSAPGASPFVLDARGYNASTVAPGNAWRPHEPTRPELYWKPTPRALLDSRLPDRSCFDDRCSGLLMSSTEALNIAQRDSLIGRFSPSGSGTRSVLTYDWSRLLLTATRYAAGGGAHVAADDDFVLSGLPAGTPVSFNLQLTASLVGYNSYGSCNPCEHFARAVSAFDFAAAETRRSLSVEYRLDTTMVIPVQVRAGEPFRVHLSASGSMSSPFGPIDVSTGVRLTPMNLPAGTRLTSCWGYRTDSPVATESSLQSVAAFADRVELAWHISAATRVRIERREQGAFDWSSLGELFPDGLNTVRWVDRSVRAGESYEYRLAWQQGGVTHTSPEVSVAVPSAFRFALHGPRPNPSHGEGAIWLELAHSGAVTLELYDVAGRRLGSTSRTFEPGLHAVPMPVAQRLPPGVYHVRSHQGGQEARRTFVVVQ